MTTEHEDLNEQLLQRKQKLNAWRTTGMAFPMTLDVAI